MAGATGVSDAFETFMREAPEHAKAWMGAAQALGAASALEPKTRHLAYVAVLAAMRLGEGLPFHVGLAKTAGATRAEVASAVLIGLPAAGNAIVHALPVALAAYDGA
jgi:alkylhydroperoxidase/carboxymuconolactone decarboxylase family protein YurZ